GLNFAVDLLVGHVEVAARQHIARRVAVAERGSGERRRDGQRQQRGGKRSANAHGGEGYRRPLVRPPVVIAMFAVLAALTAVAGSGSSTSTTPDDDTIPPTLLAQVRPVGAGPRFAPPAPDRQVPDCRARLGARDGAHVELFARDRVVIVSAGI